METGLDGQVRKQEVTLRDPASALLGFNPVGRVPTLELDDGTILTESRLILCAIDTLHDGKPVLPSERSARWRTLAEIGTAIGMLDGIVTWSRELRRPKHEQSPAVISLETIRVNRTADALERAVAAGAYSEPDQRLGMALGCVLGLVDPRHPIWHWRNERPALAAWFNVIAARPSFRQTAPLPP